MAGHEFAILDPAAGISGDMLLGALLDAGAPDDWLGSLPARLGIPDVTIESTSVMRCSVRCRKVTVRLPDGEVEGPGDAGQEHNGHPHHHSHGPHRHVKTLIGMVEKAEVSAKTRELACRAFQLVAEAEGRVHGIAPERVSLHEVGAYDALVDIVGGIEGFEQLGIDRVYSTPAALGSGWVRAAHGLLPVPAPATTILAEGLEVSVGGFVTGEATTPTGAALLRVLSQGAPPSRWRPLRTAWGAGTRDPEAWPNALRLILAEGAAEAAQVVLLAADIDDLSPEYLEPLREATVTAGALDVQIWPTQMKKGRIGFRIEVLCPPDRADSVAEAMFRHSTTVGLRRSAAERVTLARRQWELHTPTGGTVRMKTVDAPGGPRAKPEFDDVVAEARRSGRPAHVLARELQDQAGRHPHAPVGEPARRTTVPKESE
ncbi:MAG TPA: nickel pincer cofactor biosynthesis protein LarC [Gemmatimonadales bacterium]|nr:nickel pincer cofactor biosynthesis protein LarC [Gemmatimonadales bacterium]